VANATWFEAVEDIQPHIVRILTPQGSGTGFLISNGRHNSLCAFATAAHVIDHAHFWEQPIRLDHDSGKSIVVRKQERAVFLDSNRDTAAILLQRGDLPIPTSPLSLVPESKYMKVGNELGWLGYPAIARAKLCFFTGVISAWLQDQSAYFVDGVAISGVSGGPAFHVVGSGSDRSVLIAGVVSAYMPNRATGDVLPGLSVVRDVSQFHELIPTFTSLDQAQRAEPPSPEPPPPSPEHTPQGRSGTAE
jgi:hypothetical protein